MLGLIIVLGVGLLIYSGLASQQRGTTTDGSTIEVPNLEQFSSKGRADATVTIVEFPDL